jgi:transketolase
MRNLIKKIIDVSYKCQEGHIPSSLSVLDILYVLYNDVMKLDPIREQRLDRDRLILSKGHAALGLYTILEHFNLLKEDIYSFSKFNSLLGVHPTDKLKYIECSTGSLGHGLPIAVGMALSYKIQNLSSNVYVIIGDGEANEGTIWESALVASNYHLNNLYCILDHNHSTNRALKIDNVFDKFKEFRWACMEIDGHNHFEIKTRLTKKLHMQPKFILANTIKGHGCKMIENKPEWHHKSPNEEQYNLMIDYLK